MRYGRLADLVRLAMQMQGRADGLSLDDIGQTFEVSRRTAERMRDAIRDTFPQTEELAELSGRKRWRLPPDTAGRLADPTVDDIAALHRSIELAHQSGDFGTADHFGTLSDRLRTRLPGPKRTRLEPDIAALLEADGVTLRPGPRERIPEPVIVKQVVRRFHATALISGTPISVSGLSQTSPAGCQLRVLLTSVPDFARGHLRRDWRVWRAFGEPKFDS